MKAAWAAGVFSPASLAVCDSSLSTLPLRAEKRPECGKKARAFKKSESCLFHAILFAVAGTPAGEEITNNRPDTDTDGDGLIRMFMHSPIGRLGARHDFLPGSAIDFLAPFQGGGETTAGFPDFFSRHIGSGSHERAGVIGEFAHVLTARLCFFAHIFYVFCLFEF
jgi:hypothetical protein